MNKFAAVCLSILSVVPIASAQSGRRIEKAPPAPAVVHDDYSESKPRKDRRAALLPSLRNISGQDAEVLPANQKGGAAASQIEPENGEEVLKVDTNLVTIPVSVFDRNGLYIPNLRQSDFKIFEDGKEQEIAYFGTTDKPFTVILLIDTSPSTEYKIEEIRRAAIAFVDQLKSEDKVMVIEFDENIHVLTEITGDRLRIYKAIGKADFGYGTSLYEAVDFSLRKRLSAIEGRKAIVLFTDGVDTTSRRAGYDSTLGLAEEADALVFPIYYNTFQFNRGGGSPFPGGRTVKITQFSE